MNNSGFKITPLMPDLENGPALVQRTLRCDERGAFARIFCAQALGAIGWPGALAQINHSRTDHKGTLRGLHYQRPPHAEAKLVVCIRGSIYDVAVDIRGESPTRFAYASAKLCAQSASAIYIPEGFAHGFQTLSDDVELIYMHSAPYTPNAEAGIRYDDPALAIKWPLPLTALSERDASFTPVDVSAKAL